MLDSVYHVMSLAEHVQVLQRMTVKAEFIHTNLPFHLLLVHAAMLPVLLAMEPFPTIA